MRNQSILCFCRQSNSQPYSSWLVGMLLLNENFHNVYIIWSAIVGDITPYDGISKSEKLRREQEALDHMCKLLGGGSRGMHIQSYILSFIPNGQDIFFLRISLFGCQHHFLFLKKLCENCSPGNQWIVDGLWK